MATTSSTLAVGNSRVTLSLPAPPTPNLAPSYDKSTLPTPPPTYAAGSTLYPTVTLHGDPSYTSLSLRLVCQTHTVIMGLDRWQIAIQTSSGMGSSGMMITSNEAVPFFEVEVPLVGKSGARKVVEKGEKQGASGEEGRGGTYEVQLPMMKDGQVLPSYKKQEEDITGAAVTYTLELLGTRKGMFKSNDRLSLEIPVSIPSLIPSSTPRPSWPFVAHSKDLKFKSQSGDSLTLEAILSHEPLSSTLRPLRFSLTLSSSSSGLSLITNEGGPKVSATLSRRTRTTPIDTSKGKQMDWAGVRIAKGVMKSVDSCGLEWEGKVEVPVGQHTIESEPLGVKYYLGVQISSPALEHDMIFSTIVFLPSSTVKVTSQEEEGTMPAGDLPSYAA